MSVPKTPAAPGADMACAGSDLGASSVGREVQSAGVEGTEDTHETSLPAGSREGGATPADPHRETLDRFIRAPHALDGSYWAKTWATSVDLDSTPVGDSGAALDLCSDMPAVRSFAAEGVDDGSL